MELVLFELGPSRMAFPARGISKVLEPLRWTPKNSSSSANKAAHSMRTR